MQIFFKNTAKISLTVLVAFSVLLLNFSNFIYCSAGKMNDDCCHKSRTIKTCCLKYSKITLNERISSHCGCTFNNASMPGDLYSELNNNSSKNISRLAIYITASFIMQPETASLDLTDYSPPVILSTEIYLNNLSLRI